MNLYNKLYEAIDNGLQKSLNTFIIDDENDHENNVNYKRSNIQNNFDILGNYIDDLINAENDIELKKIYKQIIKYCNNNDIVYKGNNPYVYDNLVQNMIETLDDKQIKFIYSKIKMLYEITNNPYQVKNMQELYNIFTRLINTKNITLNNIVLDWIDTTNAMTFILKDDQEVSIFQYLNDNKNNANINFIKFTNLPECNHDLIIYFNNSNKYSIYYKELTAYSSWCDYSKQAENFNDRAIPKTLSEYDGWEHTYRNVNIWNGKNNDFSGYPAFEYASNLCEKEHLDGYQAYIPSLGEIEEISIYQKILNYIYYKLNSYFGYLVLYAKKYENFCFCASWTSTEYDKTYAYTFGNNKYETKNSHHTVYPFFKKIKGS